ncbi:acylphosphatase [Maribellus sediminis]|uniref:acylphosphatase n=1 Tax=Maribellus sediminis TaxID=2696285 RepID=UPI00143026C5|nr:acylphosphatase [Maribellus sediminis]
MLQYEIKISGRVQGVGFRYFTQKQATIFDLTGWVRNTPSGGVVVMVQGEKAVLDTFVDYLRIGPPLSRVTTVSVVEMKITENFSDFRVKY